MTTAELYELEMKVREEKLRAEIQAIRDEADVGSVGGSKWAVERLGMTFELIKERVLYPFRDELEGQIVYYADISGVKWKFNKSQFNQWIEQNFDRINWGGK